MFAKLMSISDDLMFRYYELLTDMSLAEIAGAARSASPRGDLHPMQAKIDLARSIVTDFHSAADAERAAEEFNRVVRRREVPSEVRTVAAARGRARRRAASGWTSCSPRRAWPNRSATRKRKIKAGAVEINGEKCHRAGAARCPPESGSSRSGKNWRRVVTLMIFACAQALLLEAEEPRDSARRPHPDRRHPQRDAGFVFRRRQVSRSRPRLRARHRDGRAGRRHHRHRRRIHAARLRAHRRGRGECGASSRCSSACAASWPIPISVDTYKAAVAEARHRTGRRDHQRPHQPHLRRRSSRGWSRATTPA